MDVIRLDIAMNDILRVDVLERPRDVALLSMREQARQAGVQPATMTRLAKHLGMDGYDEVRELYAAAVRDGDLGFAGKAGVDTTKPYKFKPFTPTLSEPLGEFHSFIG